MVRNYIRKTSRQEWSIENMQKAADERLFILLEKEDIATIMKDLDDSPFSPNYSIIFGFEKNFNSTVRLQWFQTNWHHSFYYCGIYMFLIFSGQLYMKTRKRFELRKILTAWNIFLAIFSIIGFFRVAPEMLHALGVFGFFYSVCNPSFTSIVKVSGFWTWLFCLSKVPELMDTMFIVLRKQRLIFLHWYHHITVLLFTWYCSTYDIGVARWYVVMNYLAHAMMYSYYSLKALKIKVPKFVSMTITTYQIMQMFMGLFVTLFGYFINHIGEHCFLPLDIAYSAMIMYSSYFVLFAYFFYKTYIHPERNEKIAK